jgi:hypothetical protein
MSTINRRIARRLEEAADLLQSQGADRFRLSAYRRAAATVRSWPESLDQTFHSAGLEGLEEIPGVGPGIARAIRELITRGRLPMLDRLRGAADPEKVLGSVPGIGRKLAERLHVELGIHTLEDLEAAAHDGRLDTIAGFGRKRLAGIQDSLAQRLGRVRPDARAAPRPPISELLDVDREYRDKASRGQLPLIAPRRFNPERTAWLPVLHTERHGRRYTALFSNTARAHRLGKTRDWVVIYTDDSGGDHQHTVITAGRGPHRGARIVAGREGELDQSSQIDHEQQKSHAAAFSR